MYDELTITTDLFLDDVYNGYASRKNMSLIPENHEAWTYNLVSAFLNEMRDFKPAGKRAYVTDGNGVFKFYFRHVTVAAYKMHILVDSKIEVSISTKYITQSWANYSQQMYSYQGLGGKTNKHLIMRNHSRYFHKFSPLHDSTTCLLNNYTLLFVPLNDFHECYNYFATKLVKKGLAKSYHTKFLHEYCEDVAHTKDENINDLTKLTQHIHGLLKLNVQPKTVRKRLATVDYEGHECYILSGIYISPFTKSILTENADVVVGFLLDTTWRVMPFYVTAILMASVQNVGIPLAFAFGNSENKSLYSELLKTVSEEVEYDFTRKVIESDQGTALKSAIAEYSMIHIACLRHLLVSLKFNQFTFLLNKFIKAASEKDSEYAKTLMINEYRQITDTEKLKIMQKTLKKVGLMFINESIEIVDSERWNSVSMLYRKTLKMPSTTNSLESTHGHLNQKTPRNNNFYRSIFRIVKHLTKKVKNCQDSIIHNYNHTKHQTRKRLSQTLPERMNEECRYYETSIDTCKCSENKVIEASMCIDIPCSHRLSLGASFLPLQPVSLVLKEQWKTLCVKFNALPPEVGVQALSIDDIDKNYACSQIKRFSHYKNNDEIKKFVDDQFNHLIRQSPNFLDESPEYILNIIGCGIAHFVDIIKAKE